MVLEFVHIPPIRNKIFNYQNVVNDIDNFKNIKCECENSEYCHKDLNHIVTGDLSIIKNDQLRKIMTYGPTYRIPKKTDWEDTKNEINKSITECIKLWSRIDKVDKKSIK